MGKGYQTLQSLLLDFCQWQPSEALLNALLDMLVDGKFDIKASPLIKVSCQILFRISLFFCQMDLMLSLVNDLGQVCELQ